MGNISDKATPYVAGAGLYYIGIWIFTFYPAFILSLGLQRLFFGVSEDTSAGALVFGLIAMIVGTFTIVGLAAAKQYFIILMMYVLMAWPFLYIVRHLCVNAGEMDQYPLPLDWWPLW